MKFLLRKIQCRTRYWWRKLLSSFDVCPSCGAALNITRAHKICPQCNYRTTR